jgi:hypothetical protein
MKVSNSLLGVTAVFGVIAFALMYWALDVDFWPSILITFGYFVIAVLVKGMRSGSEDS